MTTLKTQKTKWASLHAPFKHILSITLLMLFSLAGKTQNAISVENALPGSPASEWQISGAGDLSIQGFSADISVNKGQSVRFKINVTGANRNYVIRIYRLGYYQGNGARLIADLGSFAGVVQPAPITETATGLVDCGNWSESASWLVPTTAVSGVYIARLIRADNLGASHIVFVVRDDNTPSDLLFKTSDATWQAYNVYGGNSLYVGSTPGYTGGHAVKVSYNRPFITRNGGGGGGPAEDWIFNAEYPMIRWLERNGYDVSYTTDVDMDRDPAPITTAKCKAFLSVGHDEYWSLKQRNKIEAARAAGVHLAFFSGNEVYWKTRWENSIDGTGTPSRTLVCYKEGTLGENVCNGECDPSSEWTGLWRDGCGATGAIDGCRPENALTGHMSWALSTASIQVPSEYKNLRIWRNTSIASLPNGQTATLPMGTLGYEWDYENPDYLNTYPPGRIVMSSTTVGDNVHKLSLYRHPSRALVFGAGTVQWSWGLDSEHDRGNAPPSIIMQQATVNLLADMGVQPANLQNDLIIATASTDIAAPASVIASPEHGVSIPFGTAVNISGTAADLGGGVVAAVEVSTDGGASWRRANGTTSWTLSWTPSTQGEVPVIIMSRAIDDNGNIEAPGQPISSNAIAVSITPPPPPICPCTVFQPTDVPVQIDNKDGPGGINVGMKFRSYIDGFITAVRFYKGATATGTFVGKLYTLSGTELGSAQFATTSGAGWQEINFPTPIPIEAGEIYIVSYFSSDGYYSVTIPFFTSSFLKYPLIALASSAEGFNGVYRYGNSPLFPTEHFRSSNYWVDAVFNTSIGPDLTAPFVVTSVPANNAVNVSIGTSVSIIFNENIDQTSVDANTVELRDGLGTVVPSTISYNSGSRSIVIVPNDPLDYSSVYTVLVKGGSTGERIKDLAGNFMAANFNLSFTTQVQPPPPPIPPAEGPGGPILVVSSSFNPYSRYTTEILRAEGWNAYRALDITQVTSTELANYDVVVVGKMTLTTTQASMLSAWATAGGTLILFQPDNHLYSLLGITNTGGTLSEGYQRFNTDDGPGVGIVKETIQFHGTANLYTVTAGTSVLATLFSDATTATVHPAVVSKNVGSNGGRVVAFAYDLARSIVLTRQGNPAWSGQERDGQSGPIRSNDLFFGSRAGDIQKDWVDLNKVAIPQADELQRFLSNVIVQGNLDKKPLPRFWFLPSGFKAAVVMTGDDHANGGTAERFNQYLALSGSNNSPEDVADWKAVRSTSYIYPGTPISDPAVENFQEQGFEIALHLNTQCQNFTETTLRTAWDQQLPLLATQLPSLFTPKTNRTHCLAWSDWATQARVQAEKGIRLDVNYYYWPGSWIQNRPGMFTGSGLPMRFADLDGKAINCFQVTTQMTDESGQIYPGHVNALLDKAVGQEGFFGVFCANMHTDNASAGDISTLGSNAIVASAQSRQIPVISAKQLLDWLDGLEAATINNQVWSGSTLTFQVNSDPVLARNIQAMIPAYSNGNVLKSMTYNGSALNYSLRVVKGIEYAFFNAPSGNYTAVYGPDLLALEITNVQVQTSSNGTAVITWTTNKASSSKIDYGVSASSLNLATYDATPVLSHSLTLTGLTPLTTYYFRVTSVDALGISSTSPATSLQPLSFQIPCSAIGVLQESGLNCPLQEIKLRFVSTTATAPYTLVLNNQTVSNVPNNTQFNSGLVADPVTDATLWALSESGGQVDNDLAEVELGVKFRTTVPGFIKGIRFYKTIESGTGTFTVKLWNNTTGQLASAFSVASKTFLEGDLSSGWQTVFFSSPIQVEANTTYIATYTVPNGRYQVQQNYFNGFSKVNGPLRALASGIDGTNGVYRYGTAPTIPTESFSNSNYWVDVIFNGGTKVTLSSITDANGCVQAAPNIQTLYVASAPCVVTPVTFRDFTLQAKSNNVELFWSTASESNNRGFDVERSTTGNNWTKIGFVPGVGNSQTLQKYSYTDKGLNNGKYFYRLRQVDIDGRFAYSRILSATINGIYSFSLDQNFPNPTSGAAVIPYSVPLRTQVRISLYDVQGRMIRELVNETREPGFYTYNFSSFGLAKGIYYYRMQAGEFSATRKLVVN